MEVDDRITTIDKIFVAVNKGAKISSFKKGAIQKLSKLLFHKRSYIRKMCLSILIALSCSDNNFESYIIENDLGTQVGDYIILFPSSVFAMYPHHKVEFIKRWIERSPHKCQRRYIYCLIDANQLDIEKIAISSIKKNIAEGEIGWLPDPEKLIAMIESNHKFKREQKK